MLPSPALCPLDQPFKRVALLTALLLQILAGCGQAEVTSRGSGTLQVNALLQYDVSLEKAGIAEVKIADAAQAPVAGAEVKLTCLRTQTVYTLPEAQLGLYRLDATTLPYLERSLLEIRRGSDWLTMRMRGPGPHLVERPKAGETLSSAEPLTVRWGTWDGWRAHQVAVNLLRTGYHSEHSQDAGQLVIPKFSLPEGRETLVLRRAERQVPKGALSGSLFEVAYQVRVDLRGVPSGQL